MNEVTFEILVIEENSKIRENFIKILSPYAESFSSRWSLHLASSKKEGMEVLEKKSEKGTSFAIVFLEIGENPTWTGLETALQIWEMDSDIQIVMGVNPKKYPPEEIFNILGHHDNLLLMPKPLGKLTVWQIVSALTKKWQLVKESKNYNELLNRRVEERTEFLKQSLSLLRATIESSSDGILVLDLEGKVVDYNQHFINIWDVPESEMLHRKGSFLQDFLYEKLQGGEKFKQKIKYLNHHINESSQQIIKLINQKIYECSSKPHQIDGITIGRVWSFHDITEQTWLQEKLEYQASHDGLTNLPNRVLLYDRIEQAIAKAARQKTNFAVIFLDVDRFKLINDSLTHEIGDELLREISLRLSHLMRKEDTLARLGGDEFVIVVPELAKEGYMVNVAQKILQSFEESFEIAGRKLILGASIGISIYPVDGTSLKTLLRNADLAMYQSKERGGNQFRFYTSILNQQSRLRLGLESELRRAIHNEEFFLVYQPQFSLSEGKDGQIIGAEALLRWQHPKKGLVLPVDFIPVAEESGLIVPLGEWVIAKVCEQVIAWRNNGLPYLRISLNIALHQLKQYYFAEGVQSILSKYQIPEEYIEFELAENMLLAHPEVIRMVQSLKKTGASISVDDFGLGSSSLSYLKKMPIDSVKIERSLIQNISLSKSDEAIVISIMNTAERLGLKVVAKGVEKAEQIEFLKAHNCHEVQGFYFSQPVTKEEIEALYHASPFRVC